MVPRMDFQLLSSSGRFLHNGGGFEPYIAPHHQLQQEPYGNTIEADDDQDDPYYIPEDESWFANHHATWQPERCNPPLKHEPEAPPNQLSYEQYAHEQYAQLIRFAPFHQNEPIYEQHRMDHRPRTPPLKSEREVPPFLQLETEPYPRHWQNEGSSFVPWQSDRQSNPPCENERHSDIPWQIERQSSSPWQDERQASPPLQIERPFIPPASWHDEKQSNPPSQADRQAFPPPQYKWKCPPPPEQKKWLGWTNFAGQQQTLQCVRVSQLYGALHRHYMLSCPYVSLESGTRVLVSWQWEPTAQQGVSDVRFKSAAEVASELAELRPGTVDDHRSNEGGILQLAGNPDLFWSAILHWHMHGTCMPLTYADLGSSAPRPRPPQQPRPEVKSPAGPRIRRVNESLSRTNPKQFPDMEFDLSSSNSTRVPSSDLPSGWQDAKRAWDKALERAARIGYVVHCMFYCTEMGCAAKDTCPLRHCDRRRQWCRDHAALERARRASFPRPAGAAAHWEASADPLWHSRKSSGPKLRRSSSADQEHIYVLSERM